MHMKQCCSIILHIYVNVFHYTFNCVNFKKTAENALLCCSIFLIFQRPSVSACLDLTALYKFYYCIHLNCTDDVSGTSALK